MIAKLASEMTKYYKVKIICNTIDPSVIDLFNKKNINFEIFDNWNFKKILKKEKEKCYITFFLKDYLQIKFLKNKLNHVFMYIVNPKILWLDNTLKSKLKRFLCKKIIKKYIKSSKFIFMDEQCLESTLKSYRLNENISKIAKLIRISVDDINVDRIIKEKSNRIKLLSVSRAEFPFKGYLIGLLKWFNKYCSNDERFELTIVSYGPDIEKVEYELNNLSDNAKKRICFLGKTNNEKLKEMYLNSDFYIGMGTTILEASQLGCVSYAVEPYKYDLVVNKSFEEAPNKVALHGDEDNLVIGLKEELLNIYEKNYDEKSKRHREVIRNMYSLSKNAKEFIKIIEEDIK